MDIWDLISVLDNTDINTIIGSVSAAVIAIIGAIGHYFVRKENNKRREHWCNPTCCITGRKLSKKPSNKTANAKTKK